MKILEVKNNLVKVSFTAEDKLLLGGFVIIEDSQCPYVAQIMSLKADSGLNYAIVKLLFTFNEEGVVKNYNGTIPELNASITPLSSDELLDILPIEIPLKIGKLAQQKFILNIDFSALEKNMLICSDKTENTDILLSNFAKQITELNNKSVIFDPDSTINAENKLIFGKDFKLPLNYDSINFIYENDLNDVPPASKAVIQDIFLEVQEYSQTVLDNFIPVDNFIAVVDAQYRELNIPELAILKNRLLKYKEENVFAQNAKEFQSLRAAVRGNMSTLLDISCADDILQKQIMNYVYDEINAMDLFVYSIVKINDSNADKKLIRKFLAQDKIYTVIAAPHNYKYIYELKDRASNIIMFAPQTTQHDFAAYNIFLNKLNEDECLIYGKATQNIPLILEIQPLEILNLPEPEPESKVDTEETTIEQEPEKDDFSEESDSYSYETMVEDTVAPAPIAESIVKPVMQGEEVIPEPLPAKTEEPAKELIKELPKIEEILPKLQEQVQTSKTFEEVTESDLSKDLLLEQPAQVLNNEAEELPEPELLDDFQEEPTSVTTEQVSQVADITEQELFEDVPVEEQPLAQTPIEQIEPMMEPDLLEELQVEQETIQPLADNTVKPEDFSSLVDVEATENSTFDTLDEFEELTSKAELLPTFDDLITEKPVQDNLTENDLDYLQNINMPQDENLQTFEELEDSLPELKAEVDEQQQNEVPIYPTEELTTNKEDIAIEIGDKVSHPKYGEGIVEKMLKYGNKVLWSINFQNGRRLLDPTISKLQKV